MVNYSRIEKKFLRIRYTPLTTTKEKICLIILFLLTCMPALISSPGHAFGMDKIAVLPFKVEAAGPSGSLSTSLQEILSQQMSNIGFEAVNTEMINAILGDSIPFSAPEKKIIPFGKTNNADWIIMGEFTEKDGSIQLNVMALDTDTGKTPFSVMMIENDRKNLDEALKKIAKSLGVQIRENIIISDIIVKGSMRASEDAILNIIESQKGDQFDQEKLNRDLRTIYKMGFFEDVFPVISDDPEGKVITFNLVEKPTIIKITFEGNKRKKDDKLMEEVGIKKYSTLNRNEVKQSINRLLEFYRNAGYYNIEIKGQIKTLEDKNEVIVNYVIDEGEKVYITKIEFKGNKVFKSDDLKDIMLTKEKGWLTWFTDSGVLDKKKLELHDLQKLKIYYDNHGYLKAQIGEQEISYDEEEKGLILSIPIIEGDQYMVNDIIIKGDLLIPAESLRKIIDVKKGDPFSRQIFYTETDKIKALYADMGYYYAEAQPSWDVDESTRNVDVTINIKKLKRVRIERINIFGNEITRDKVFRRELKLAEGDYFSGQKLERSKENLDRIEIFENHEAKIRNGSSDELIVIDIEGEEQLRRSVSFSAGYGGYEKFMVQLQYANNNLFGRGQNLSLNAMLGETTTQFNITLTDPWLFDQPVRGSIALYNSETDYDDYTRKRLGAAGGVGFLLGLDDYTRGTVNYSYDKSEYTDIASYAQDYYQASELVTSSTTLGIERNSKDKWWDTHKGSLNYFTFEYAGGFLGGDSAFNKYILHSTFYLPVTKNTVFVITSQLGFLQGRSGGLLPAWEQFYTGGIDSVRGYEWGSLSPLHPTTNSILGGTREWLYKLEYRVPLGKGAQGLTGLIFFDTGNAYKKRIILEEDGPYVEIKKKWNEGAGASVGFGLRWFSPMGPLRLEYGYKLKDNRRDTDSGRFEFTISGSY